MNMCDVWLNENVLANTPFHVEDENENLVPSSITGNPFAYNPSTWDLTVSGTTRYVDSNGAPEAGNSISIPFGLCSSAGDCFTFYLEY